MSLMPWGPWAPDAGVYANSSLTVATNVLRTANGVAPINAPSSVSTSLGSQCYGAWVYRNSEGAFGFIAATQTDIFKLASDGTWTSIKKLGGYTGPDAGDLWQADLFGPLLIFVNANDPPQQFDIDLAVVCSDLGGSPPRAKYIETVGDFVFLSFHRDAGDDFPRRWQHSMLNDAENWTIDGQEGSSDRQDVPDGDDIVGVFACPGGARLIQRKCKRRLTFSPGAPVAFTQTDIDPSRGAIAPNAIVNIGGDNYIYLNETGFYAGDEHAGIGQEKVDRYFLENINLDSLSQVQAVNDPTLKIVWFRYQTGDLTYRMIGYNWGLGEWLDCDAPVQLLVTAVTVGVMADDILDAMDDYLGVPVDSDIFKGGRVTPGAFLEDDQLYLFAGTPMEATLETNTVALNPGMRTNLVSSKLIGDVPAYSVAVARMTLIDDTPSFGSGATRSLVTGKVPHRSDAFWHRLRVTIPEATSWSICHGIDLEANPSGGA